MKNKYGLDDEYFKEQLNYITDGIEHYSPAELVNELSRLLLTAADQDDINVEIKFRNLHRHK